MSNKKTKPNAQLFPIVVKMTTKNCSRETWIEEEDFCDWTEKDVEFKCLEGLNAKLKKFYSLNKAIVVRIEIDGTPFQGCLYQDDNSFAPVTFGLPKRSPLPCIFPSKSPRRKKNTETTSFNAYSRENWPRIYIDPRNTVEQRFRPRKVKHPYNNQWITMSHVGEEKSHRRAKKLGVLVYSNRKKSSRHVPNSKNNNSGLRRSKRLCNLYDETQYISEYNGFMTDSSNRSPAFKFSVVSPKSNKDVAMSIGHKAKRRGALRETSISPKSNLRPRRVRYGSEHESVGSDSYESFSSQCLSIDPTVVEMELDEIQHPTDMFNHESTEINEASAHEISQRYTLVNPKNKEENKITIFESGVLSPTLCVRKSLKSMNKATEEINGLPKPRKKKKRKAASKECLELSDKFEKMTISTTAQSSNSDGHKREMEEDLSKIPGTEMRNPNSAISDSTVADISSLFKF